MMERLSSMFALIVACAAVATASSAIDDTYLEFLDGQPFTDEQHKAEFAASLQYIEDNDRELPYTLGITSVADLIEADNPTFFQVDGNDDGSQYRPPMRKLLRTPAPFTTVTAPPQQPDPSAKGMVRSTLTSADMASWPLHSHVDWRPLAPPVLQQHLNGSRCGACWAFATTAGISIAHAQKTGRIVQLSQQQLVSCDKAARGCGGGGAISAMRYVYENKGIATEQTYPYVARTGTCKDNLAKQVAVQVKGYHRLPKYNETAMELAVGKGPIMVGINTHGAIFRAWKLYTGGILDPSHLCNTTNDLCAGDITHFVTIVGMSDMQGVPVWIIRNSWGVEWGEDGYGYIPRNRGKEGMFNIARSPVVPVV